MRLETKKCPRMKQSSDVSRDSFTLANIRLSHLGFCFLSRSGEGLVQVNVSSTLETLSPAWPSAFVDWKGGLVLPNLPVRQHAAEHSSSFCHMLDFGQSAIQTLAPAPIGKACGHWLSGNQFRDQGLDVWGVCA